MDKQAGLAGATSSASCCAPPASQSGKAHTTPSCTSLPRPHILCTARQSACHTTNASCHRHHTNGIYCSFPHHPFLKCRVYHFCEFISLVVPSGGPSGPSGGPSGPSGPSGGPSGGHSSPSGGPSDPSGDPSGGLSVPSGGPSSLSGDHSSLSGGPSGPS